MRQRFGSLLAEPPRNGIYKEARFHGSGVKIINMGEIFAHPRLYPREMPRVSLTSKELGRFGLRTGDLLFARRSLVAAGAGKCAIVCGVNGPTVFESSIIRARLDPDAADPRFVYYFFSSPDGKYALDTIRREMAVSGITGRDLQDLEVNWPPLAEQRAMADVLTAIDDRVDADRRVTELLDSYIATSLSTAGDNWQEVPISALAGFVNGGAYTKGATGKGRLVIRIAELKNGPTRSSIYNELVVPDDRVARPGDILLAWSGSLGVHRWVRPEAIINQHIFKVLTAKYPPWLVFSKLQEALPELRAIAADKTTTMGHIERHHLDETTVTVPAPDELSSMEALLSPMWLSIIARDREGLKLAELRDFLATEFSAGGLRLQAQRNGS